MDGSGRRRRSTRVRRLVDRHATRGSAGGGTRVPCRRPRNGRGRRLGKAGERRGRRRACPGRLPERTGSCGDIPGTAPMPNGGRLSAGLGRAPRTRSWPTTAGADGRPAWTGSAKRPPAGGSPVSLAPRARSGLWNRLAEETGRERWRGQARLPSGEAEHGIDTAGPLRASSERWPASHGRWPGQPLERRRFYRRGRSRRKSEPSPRRLSAWIGAWCASATMRTSDMPSPVPRSPLVLK